LFAVTPSSTTVVGLLFKVISVVVLLLFFKEAISFERAVALLLSIADGSCCTSSIDVVSAILFVVAIPITFTL
jgi:hypothetical protein